MKKLKLVGFLLGLMLLAGKVYASDPTPPEERVNASKYAISHSSVNVGSMTAVQVAAAGTGYRSITIANQPKDIVAPLSGGVTVFYRIDGLITGTTVWGQVLLPGEKVTVETQNSVRAQLASTASSATVRVMIKQKN
jgi:hypothetical protein